MRILISSWITIVTSTGRSAKIYERIHIGNQSTRTTKVSNATVEAPKDFPEVMIGANEVGSHGKNFSVDAYYVSV